MAKTVTASGQKIKKTSQTKEVMKRLFSNKSATVCMFIFLAFIFAAIFAPLLAPYDPTAMDPTAIYSGPTMAHPFGCDKLGRDILSRMLYGGRYSLSLGVLGVLLSLVIGMIFGSIAGFFGQVADNIVMRIMDIVQAIPGMLLSMVISTVLGPGFINTIIALSIGGIPMNCRMLRSSILSIRSSEYVEAASSINCSKARIIIKHIIPNCFAPLLVGSTMGIGGTIMQAAGLSFIGLGVQPPTPEWGAMLSEGRNFVATHPHLIAFPGIAIGIVSLVVCIWGDGLRDAMDPRLKK